MPEPDAVQADTTYQFSVSDVDNSSSESDSSINSEEDSHITNIRDDWSEWAITFNVPHATLSALLTILRRSDIDLPKDHRTLLSTPRLCDVKSLAGGTYCHIGVANGIHSTLSGSSVDLDNCDTLTLRVNVDGIPLSRSSTTNLWPLLCTIQELSGNDPFVVGVFSGTTKPSSVNEFLFDFIQEMKVLNVDGVLHDAKLYTIVLDAFICDAPARALLKCTKGHNGYHACERCTQSGVYTEGRMTFPEVTAPARTNVAFDELRDEEHHLTVSPLRELEIGCVSNFVLDYMHLVCLGVVRKLIFLWLKGPLKCRMPASLLTVVST